jgi:FKBP-type peptidyl-prolyl cis-trans isomerase
MQTPPSAAVPARVVIQELILGRGALAERGDDVVVHYVGKLLDGTQFDSSRNRRDPLGFSLGAGDLIKGLDQGIEGMRVGGMRKITIPAEFAYGDSGCGGVIPPGATLVFDVELLEVA